MFPVKDLVIAVLRLLPVVFIEPSVALVFWLIALLTVIQARRLAANEERIFGTVKNRTLEVSASGLFFGLVGGLIASLLMVFIGVSLSGSGISYLLPIAFILYAINPRLMCYSYAGGLLSISNLLFGFPQVSVPGIMALVAILHITEAVLISVSGGSCAMPVYLKSKTGRTVGGFYLQRFWPMPLVALIMIASPEASEVTGLIQMPDWWPLIRPREAASLVDAVFAMVPIVAALGYSDMAITRVPVSKARSASWMLGVYSVTLLGLAAASVFIRPVQWLAALFGPLGHEAVVALGGRGEMTGIPLFVPPERGVMVLDVLPDSPAAGAGLGTGDIITEVTGIPVNSREELTGAVKRTPVFLELTVHPASKEPEREVRFRGVIEDLGIITVPEAGDRPHVEVRSSSLLKKAMESVRKIVGNWIGSARK